MSKVKLAMTLPTELAETARAAVRDGRAPSVSAYITEAVYERVRREHLVELLDAMDAELGAPSGEAEAWARHVLQG
ncbi:MAG: toxin-antitoxin system antitoxin subunit [Acidimicrobiales bacterium]